MASRRIFNILNDFKSSYNFKNSLSIVPLAQPSNIIFVRNASTAYTSYTKERKLNENFKPRWKKCLAVELNKRRAKVAIDEKLRYGHEKIVRRSQFTDWNYPAEISAFQARLSEQFDEDKLLQSFKTREYLEDLTMQRRITFGVENDNIYSHNNDEHLDDSNGRMEDRNLSKKDLEDIEADSNENLALIGNNIIGDTLKAFVRIALPNIPEEGVEAINSYLTSDEMLSRISFHIGTKDLILSKEYPPSRETYANVFKAIVGALSLSDNGRGNSNNERAMKFVVEIVGSQLHGKDITDIWNVENPTGILTQVLKNEGRDKPDFRLLWVNGQDTILACYHVGVYCNKELIGQSPGETVDIAQDMAARDALRKLFCFDDCSKPIGFQMIQKDTKILQFTQNVGIKDWSSTNTNIM